MQNKEFKKIVEKPPSFFQTASAFWIFDRQERWSYPMAIVNHFFGLSTLVFLLYFAGKTVESSMIATHQSGDVFLFTLSGYAILQMLSSSLSVYASRVRISQLTGLLEACLMTRTPLWQVLMALPTYSVSAAMLRMFFLLLTAVFLSGSIPSITGTFSAFIFTMLGLIAFLALGVISGAITLVIKVGDPVAKIVSMGSLLIAGTFFPKEVLPPILAKIGGFFPISPVLDGLRGALWGQLSLTQLAQPLTLLITETLFLIIIAGFIARWAIRRVLADGSLSHY